MSGSATSLTSEARRVRRTLFGLTFFISFLLAAAVFAALVLLSADHTAADIREAIVALNEARMGVGEQAANAALVSAQETLRTVADERRVMPLVLVGALGAVGLVALWTITTFLYVSVVKPFMRLEAFADEVSRGNLDLPLAYERSNPFGRFTWAFDNMRKEIKRARAAEALAIEQNKTTAAALSHDVKTPIASIRAYSEALEMGVAQTEEERVSFVRTIMRKCDEVAQLTDDLFLHALSDLDHITVICEPSSAREILQHAVLDFDATDTVQLCGADEAMVSVDAKRLEQALENLLANARKYAPAAAVEVEGVRAENVYRIRVRDYGSGIAPEDIPFVFDRFYRGANKGDAPGAGLGLFIVRYLIGQMDGTVRLENAKPGLAVVIELPLTR